MRDRRRRHLQRYGRLAIGQQVLHTRLLMPPTTGNSVWDNREEPVTVRQHAEIVDMLESESGAIVVLQLVGGQQRSQCFNSYGQEWGGFGGLTVLREPPEQRSLIRERHDG